MSKQETVRVFIALELPEEAGGYLTAVQRALQAHTPESAVRWSSPGGFHVTLVFLGDVPVAHLDKVAESIARAAQGIEPFTLHLSSLGCFPSERHPSVIWFGVAGELGPLGRLQGHLARTLGGWLELDERKRFKPHVTLGRVRVRDRASQRQVARLMQEVAASPTSLFPEDNVRPASEVAWTVTHVSLVQSELRPEGSRYTILHTVQLQS